MANEAVPIEAPKTIKRVTVAEATPIPQYTILKLTDPNTGAASSSTDTFGGIATEEFTGGEGLTNVSTARDGVFDLRAGGGTTITAGELVKLSGANIIEGDVVEADIIAGKVVGKARESVTIGTAETIRVEVGRV